MCRYYHRDTVSYISERTLHNRFKGNKSKEGEKMSDASEKMGQAMLILKQISEDTATPRNIRRAAIQAMEALQTDEDSPAVRASNAISILDEISQDPNCPLHSRTKIWNAVSILETISD